MYSHIEMPEPLTKCEEKELLSRLHKDIDARNTLIERNLRLIPMMINKHFRNTTWEDEDLFGIGALGLVKAIDSFKVGYGANLSTYISTCIRNEILTNLRHEDKKKLQVDAELYIGKNFEEDCIYVWDIIPSEDSDIHGQLEKKESITEMYECLEELSERDRNIIQWRFGIGTEEPLAQREIGKILGCSKSYVGALEKKIMTRLRTVFPSKYLD